VARGQTKHNVVEDAGSTAVNYVAHKMMLAQDSAVDKTVIEPQREPDVSIRI